MVVAVAARFFLVLGDLGDQRVGGQQKRRHAGCVLESGANDLRGVDNTRTHKVPVLSLVRVIAVVLALHVPNPVDDDRAVDASIFGDRLERILEGVLHDRRPHFLVPLEVELLD